MASAEGAHHGRLEFEFIMVVLFAYWQGFGKQPSLCSLSSVAGMVQEQTPLQGSVTVKVTAGCLQTTCQVLCQHAIHLQPACEEGGITIRQLRRGAQRG